MTRRTTGIWLNTASVFLAASTPLLSKFALHDAGAPLVAFVSTACALVCCVVLCASRGDSLRITRQDTAMFGSGLANAAGVIMQMESLSRVSPVLLGFISRSYILISIGLALLVLKERPRRGDWICGGIALLGLGIFIPKELGATLTGVLLALGYSFLFALSNLLARITLSARPTSSQLYVNTLVTFLFIAAYAAIKHDLAPVSGRTMALLALSGVCGSFGGLWLYYEGLRRIDFYTANVIRATSPLWVTVFAWPFFPVAITPSFVIGGTLMIASLVGMAALKAGEEQPVETAAASPRSREELADAPGR